MPALQFTSASCQLHQFLLLFLAAGPVCFVHCAIRVCPLIYLQLTLTAPWQQQRRHIEGRNSGDQPDPLEDEKIFL